MIKLKSARLQAQVNPRGAELWSVQYQGVERLWQGDPAIWSGRAPILFPVAGGCVNDQYTYQGKTYAMPKHGFARKRDFTVTEQTENSVTLMLDTREENFPFDYRFFARFTLREDAPAIDVSYIVENAGAQEMYYGLGAHEAYACPEGIEHYELVFDKDDVIEQSELVGSQITHATIAHPLRDHALSLSGKMFANDVLVFNSIQSRSVTLRCLDDARTVRVDFEGHPYLMLWQKMDAPYLCIEPWINPPEFVDHDGEWTRKIGIQHLNAKERREHTHTITFG